SNSQLGGDAASVTSNSLMCPRHFFFYASGANGALHSFPTRRSSDLGWPRTSRGRAGRRGRAAVAAAGSRGSRGPVPGRAGPWPRSEEHTSELQSRGQLVCRLLLEKNTHLIPVRLAVDDSSPLGGLHA